MSAHKPKTRGDCCNEMRPCPWVSCRHNLFLEVKENGTLMFPHGDNPDALLHMDATCTLDLASEGPRSLDDVAVRFNITRERVRQVEEAALVRFREACEVTDLRPGTITTETPYERSPVDSTLEALGLAEDIPWIKQLWSRALICDEKPSPLLMTGSE